MLRAKYIFNIGNNVAEVWAIRDGMLVVKEEGIGNLEIESDFVYAMQLCRKEALIPWNIG